MISLAYNIGGGIKLLENVSPELITPGDIEKSQALFDVTNQVTFKIKDEDIGERKLYPNPPNNSSLVKQTLVVQEALKLLNPILRQLNLDPLQDITQAFMLFEHLEDDKASILDQNLDRILKQVGFYDLGKEMEEQHTERNFKNKEWAKNEIKIGEITHGNKDEYLFELDFFIQTIKVTIERQIKTRKTYFDNYLATGRQTFLSLTHMTDHFIKFCNCDLQDSLEAKDEIERMN